MSCIDSCCFQFEISQHSTFLSINHSKKPVFTIFVLLQLQSALVFTTGLLLIDYILDAVGLSQIFFPTQDLERAY